MRRISDRTVRIMTGLITIVFLAGGGIFAVRAATGGLAPVYHVQGLFSAAGQGLIRDSDVKINGVNIGRVTKVKLDEGRALVTMEIHDGDRIPVDAKATIRPKTLFGEKFVDIDPGENETTGPFLADGQRIKNTLGGFELERVLADTYPILKAVDPAELAVILDTLAGGARGEGDAISRQIANWAKVSRVNAAHDADTRQFLTDLAALSDELATRAPDLVAGAKDLNIALPPLNERGDKLAGVLDQASRLSADVADVLEANKPFLNKNITEGGKTLQLLADNLGQIPPTLTGLRQFFQVISEVGGFPQSDGTMLARVKFVAGGGSPCGRTTDGCPVAPILTDPVQNPPQRPGTDTLPNLPALSLPQIPGLPPVPLTGPASGSNGILQLIGGLIG